MSLLRLTPPPELRPALALRRSSLIPLALLAVLLFVLACGGAPEARNTATHDTEWLRTRAERSDYRETSSYADVVSFLERVAERSPRIHLTSFGYTAEGRSLPLAVIGAADASPEAVLESGKLRVYLQGNIHGGEVCGKEALLRLLRDLAEDGSADRWSDRLVLLVAPIYNADGNERVGLSNRPRQHGPIGGMGRRRNAQDLDLNRDHMKAESPEARSFLTLLRRYDPQLLVDLHTTNGTVHAYHLTYAPPLHPNTPAAIVEALRQEWLPAITARMKERGWSTYYYGNLPFRASASERGWYTFDHRPRFNNNYLGLRNRLAILSEAYSYATFADRVASTLAFVEEILDYAHEHAEAVRDLVASAESETVVGASLALRAELEASAESVEILLGEVDEERHPYTGDLMLRRRDAEHPERMPELGTFRATESETAPAAYLVPAELDAVVDVLRAHGVTLDPMAAAETRQLERFAVTRSETASRPFEGHSLRTVEGRWDAVELTVPAGTLRAPLDQPSGRLLFSLLEPRSDDGLVAWNFFDEALAESTVYPVLREPAAASR